jgi:hypothetical protein
MMELEIQKYLRSNKTLQDLSWDYDLKYFTSPEHPNLVVFDYSLISPKNEQIVRESRGLVLEKNSWNLVAKSMSAFSFQEDAMYKDLYQNFDWDSARAYPKYDGCLITLYYYKGSWITGTRFSVDGLCYVASAYKNESDIYWRDLFIECLNFLDISFDNFTNSLNKSCTYSFELCSIHNRNIVVYENKLLKILSIFDIENLKEVDIHSETIFVEKWHRLMPNFIKVDSFGECVKIINLNQDPTENEGLVVVDKNFNRMKIRNPNFDKLSYNLNPKNEVEALKNIFYALLDNISPSSSSSSAVITKCYYNTNGSGYCFNPLDTIGSGFSGPYSICNTASDCTVTTYCWYHPTLVLPTACVPFAENPPTDYVSQGQICGGTAPCVSPNAGAESIRSNEVRTSNVCGSSWSPKASKNNFVKLADDFVNLCNWVLVEFKEYRNGNTESELNLKEVWEDLFKELKSGKSLSESLLSVKAESQIEAVIRFNSFLENRDV